MRSLLKTGLARALARTGAGRFVGHAAGSDRAPLIVGYHRVVRDIREAAAKSIPAMLISTRMLEDHLDWLARNYRIGTLDEIGERLESGRPVERLAAVTFDDGYADLYENAIPILRKKGIPATVFVVAGHVDGGALLPHDRLYLLLLRSFASGRSGAWIAGHLTLLGVGSRRIPDDPFRAARALLALLPQDDLIRFMDLLESAAPIPADGLDELRPLTWEMLERMRLAGVTIGSHTLTHPLLTMEGPARIRDEVRGSRLALQRRLGVPVDHFAYPDGRFDGQVVAAVEAAGYRFAWGVCGHRDPGRPLLTIPRRLIWERSCVDGRGRFSPDVMECVALGLFDRLRRCRRDHGTRAPRPATARPVPPAMAEGEGRARSAAGVEE